MKKKALIILLAVALIAGGVGTVVIRSHSRADSSAAQTETAADSSVEAESQIVSETDSSANSSVDSVSVSDAEAESAPSESESTEEGAAEGGSGSGNSAHNSSVPSNGLPSPSSDSYVIGDTNVISFPFTDTENHLTIDSIFNYQGYYLEDGSDEEIGSVAMIQVTNTSEHAVEYAAIHMTGGGTSLQFKASLIPAGASVLVMDADRTAYSEGSDCTYEGADIAYAKDYSLREDMVSISKNESGTITVQNITGTDIPELRLFYKNRMDSGEYIGGIAYTVRIENLAAGASTEVHPSHYDPAYSDILMVRIYEENTDQ